MHAMSAQPSHCGTSRAGTPFTSRPVRPAAARRRAAVHAASSAAAVKAPLQTLREAGRTKKVPNEQVIAAMDQLEAAHAKGSLVEGFPASLEGTWRLVFATPGPPLVKAWQYIPVPEDVVIDLSAGTISMVGVLGPLCNTFTGRCRFEADPATGGYKMVYGWEKLTTTFSSFFKSEKEYPYKERTYSFVTLTGDVAVANSSGTGGKTLMYRGPQQ